MKHLSKPHPQDCPGCSKCSGGKMAKGGPVHETTNVPGMSKAGALARESAELKSEGKHREAHEKRDEAAELHKDKLMLAKGGEVEDASLADPDDEMHEMVGKELMDHIHSKNHKGIMESLHAVIEMHKNKDVREQKED